MHAPGRGLGRGIPRHRSRQRPVDLDGPRVPPEVLACRGGCEPAGAGRPPARRTAAAPRRRPAPPGRRRSARRRRCGRPTARPESTSIEVTSTPHTQLAAALLEPAHQRVDERTGPALRRGEADGLPEHRHDQAEDAGPGALRREVGVRRRCPPAAVAAPSPLKRSSPRPRTPDSSVRAVASPGSRASRASSGRRAGPAGTARAALPSGAGRRGPTAAPARATPRRRRRGLGRSGRRSRPGHGSAAPTTRRASGCRAPPARAATAARAAPGRATAGPGTPPRTGRTR